MPIAAIRTVFWTAVWDFAPAPRRHRTFDQISALAAAAMLAVSTGATILEQSAAGNDGARADRKAEGAPVGTGAMRETLVGFFTGAPYTYPSKVTIGTQPETITIDPVHWYTDPFHNPIYYGVRVVRWGNSFGTMVDFMHSKALAKLDEQANFTGSLDGKPLPAQAPIRDTVPKLEFSHGHNMLLFTGLARLPALGANFRPYAGAGAGVLLPHTELALNSPNHQRTYEYNYAGPAAQALVGLEIKLARLSLFLEYKFTWGHYDAPLPEREGTWLGADLWNQLQRWLKGEAPKGGHVTTEIVSHQGVGGLMVRVAGRP